MAEVYKQRTEENAVEEVRTNHPVADAPSAPQAVGVYDRPALQNVAPSGMLRMIVIFAALLLLGYVLYQGLN